MVIWPQNQLRADSLLRNVDKAYIATRPLTHIWWISQILGDTWPASTRVFLNDNGGREERPWERGCVLLWAWRRRRLKRLPCRRYLTYTPSSSSKSAVACLSIMVKKMLKRVGARTQPCFTPFEMGKGSDRSPLSLTWPRWFSCSWITICRNLGGQPSRSRMSHSPVLLTMLTYLRM